MFKKTDLKESSIFEAQPLSDSQNAALSDLFDELAYTEFERLPGMVSCAARGSSDEGISEILGLPDLSKLMAVLVKERVIRAWRLSEKRLTKSHHC